ncbi:[acyl-carrier-protein] S-malonyltransferase [Alicyclobacillaceae bacterium I2511]|nr:[acyl-carrier-protein] S-malonyltransferase [Alicyclobacillaceae bacterium I2511]
MKLGFVFPGQGAQCVGMGWELANNYEAASKIVRQADEVLGFALSDLMYQGPLSQLKLTFHTQPALLTASVAAYQVWLEETGIRPQVVAGHSLGEYSALVVAGVLDFPAAVHLVYMRGRWMDEAVPAGQGGMTAVLGMEAAALEEVCRQASQGDSVVELANVNCPGQIVISGAMPAVQRAGTLAKAAGAKRVIPLEVSGPFHSSLMRPAAAKLSEALAKTDFHRTSMPIVTNVDAIPHVEPVQIRSTLEKQLYQPVLWEQDVHTMLEMGVEAFVEFGPGNILSGLIRKVDRRIPAFHVENERSLRETAQSLKNLS